MLLDIWIHGHTGREVILDWRRTFDFGSWEWDKEPKGACLGGERKPERR